MPSLSQQLTGASALGKRWPLSGKGALAVSWQEAESQAEDLGCACVCVFPPDNRKPVWRQEVFLDPVALEINSAAINTNDPAGEVQS